MHIKAPTPTLIVRALILIRKAFGNYLAGFPKRDRSEGLDKILKYALCYDVT